MCYSVAKRVTEMLRTKFGSTVFEKSRRGVAKISLQDGQCTRSGQITLILQKIFCRQCYLPLIWWRRRSHARAHMILFYRFRALAHMIRRLPLAADSVRAQPRMRAVGIVTRDPLRRIRAGPSIPAAGNVVSETSRCQQTHASNAPDLGLLLSHRDSARAHEPRVEFSA